MTNFDPAGFLLLLTVIPALVAGVVSIGLAEVASRLGYGSYDNLVVAILGLLLLAWIGAAFVVSTSMLLILAVTLSMVGAYAVTRNVRVASYGWVLGVVGLYLAFAVLAATGVYKGVDQQGIPQGVIAQYLQVFYLGGLLVFGAVGGKLVDVLAAHWGALSLSGRTSR